MASLNISSIENSICDSGNINIIGEFSGQSDEDLLNWIEGIIKYCHDDDLFKLLNDLIFGVDTHIYHLLSC